ncbi:type II toxin-antitoxin system VapC family toxin [Sphaerisporangium flaviroseum]|uniref:type II toxin-antitoxin system VapC family toxin n=1 Tax=Sphaerisporangium flaviroseum TaxID=509199 RepID=UPI0031EC476E
MILIDTGPLVAAALAGDKNHMVCVDLFTAAHLAGDELLIPSFVVTEACYMLAREAGPRVEIGFVRSLAAGDFTIVDVGLRDLTRIAQLMERYNDLPLGLVDASVIALAEKLGLTEVATLDRRHFAVVRPSHVDALKLLP